MKLTDKKIAVNKDPRTKIGRLFRRNGVSNTAELRRILALPRRTWSEKDALVDEMTAWLRLPHGKMTFRPIQAKGLEELHDFGLFGSIRVGAGKTLMSFVAPVVLEAKRPLLLIPAKLRDKTETEFAELKKHWQSTPIRIEHYEMISRENGADLLAQINPDLIIADEVHRLKNKRAACTKRVDRYMTACPGTRFVGLSGTITSRSLHDYAHLAEWCLRNLCPVPLQFNVLAEWALALDEDIGFDQVRLAPGALEKFFGDEERGLADPVAAARRAYRRRLVETPGVIATDARYVGSSMCISAVEPTYQHREIIEAAYAKMDESWETPDGQPFADATTKWRHEQELALGFFYRWQPPGPPEWMEARRKWKAAARYILRNNKRGLDSELPVTNAVRRGEYDGEYVMENGIRKYDEPIEVLYRTWRALKPSFKPNSVPVWLDFGPLEYAAQWGRDNEGIIWCAHVAFAQELSRRSGLVYYGAGGKAPDGTQIEQAKGSIIASVESNRDGRNLQKWSRALILSCPTKGSILEQLLGRQHRDGQTADEVSYDLFFSCSGHYNSFARARGDARYIQDSTGQEQKLLFADLEIPQLSELLTRRSPMWVGLK